MTPEQVHTELDRLDVLIAKARKAQVRAREVGSDEARRVCDESLDNLLARRYKLQEHAQFAGVELPVPQRLEA